MEFSIPLHILYKRILNCYIRTPAVHTVYMLMMKHIALVTLCTIAKNPEQKLHTCTHVQCISGYYVNCMHVLWHASGEEDIVLVFKSLNGQCQ